MPSRRYRYSNEDEKKEPEAQKNTHNNRKVMDDNPFRFTDISQDGQGFVVPFASFFISFFLYFGLSVGYSFHIIWPIKTITQFLQDASAHIKIVYKYYSVSLVGMLLLLLLLYLFVCCVCFIFGRKKSRYGASGGAKSSLQVNIFVT